MGHTAYDKRKNGESMRTIVIVLNDNDYGNTFRPLLETVYRAIDWNDGLTTEVVKKAIFAGIEFHYLAFQLGGNFGKSGYGTIEETVKYLGKIDVLFDEAAEADICQRFHDGGAWYLELATGKVTAY